MDWQGSDGFGRAIKTIKMEDFDPSKLSQIKKFISLYGGAKKSLGQHFLISDTVAKKMVEAALLSPSDSVLEIGPGLGVLTQELIKSKTKEIVLVEKDRDLHQYLLNRFENKNTKIICQDALLLIPGLIVESPFKVVANLPYNIGAASIISLLSVSKTLPQTMVLMLQKEVADRILAKPNDSNRGILTVFIEQFGETKLLHNVSRNLFYPPPHVDSAVIVISNINQLSVPAKVALKIIKSAFSSKRKKIKNSLFNNLKILPKEAEGIAKKCGFNLDQRPEELNKYQWTALISILKSKI
ncbi:MAG: 16S rRNA (adenine(1518)-N(6)/adenine(1519)-N(6))-dimethyltransferase RsmA [Candidatus Berkelbacteria bacterium]|nr:16S rRNA (adenine(1518)-N(6)/adenine(1519)-N(6))-dimethyltransferase RsmA [Candidatus Berkelbacteria bacterium]